MNKLTFAQALLLANSKKQNLLYLPNVLDIEYNYDQLTQMNEARY